MKPQQLMMRPRSEQPAVSAAHQHLAVARKPELAHVHLRQTLARHGLHRISPKLFDIHPMTPSCAKSDTRAGPQGPSRCLKRPARYFLYADLRNAIRGKSTSTSVALLK